MRLRLLMVLTFLCLAALAGSREAAAASSPLPPGVRSETYLFPTRAVTGFKELITGDKTPDATGRGTLFLPTETEEGDKIPLMVILHGSGGAWGGRGAAHGNLLAQNGIGALLVDTFAGRDLSRKDKYIRRLMKANVPEGTADAFGALEALQDHPLVDGTRIGVMGYSMGGTTSILAAYEFLASSCSRTGLRFALHVPFYASCIIRPEDTRPTGAPLLGLWGSEDGATLRPRCEEIMRNFESAGGTAEAVWYPGAAHGWNGTRPAKYYEELPNFAPCRFLIRSDGTVLEVSTGLDSDTDQKMVRGSERCVSFGYTVGRHGPTDKLANEALLKAVRKHLQAGR